jgi:hypothetical protein
MKPDLYTKAVLTVIAVMMTVIAAKQFVNPEVSADAQASGSQFAITPTNYFLYRNRTVSIYRPDGTHSQDVDLR